MNRFREQSQQKMPQYAGDFYRVGSQEMGGQGVMSWNAQEAEDAELGVLQTSIRRFAKDPNVVSFLEPHGELDHGPHDVFLEYGPVADRTYRAYLQMKYKTVAALGARWFNDAKHFKSWDEIRVPEIASFEGWNAQAIDLTGTWRIGYEAFKDKEPGAYELAHGDNRAIDTVPAPDAWYQEKFDDGA